MSRYRCLDWAERILADHDDAMYSALALARGRAEVERSKWWYDWQRFTDSMRELTHSIENSLLPGQNPLDTRDRIRDHGPRAEDTGSTATHGRNRGNDQSGPERSVRR